MTEVVYRIEADVGKGGERVTVASGLPVEEGGSEGGSAAPPPLLPGLDAVRPPLSNRGVEQGKEGPSNREVCIDFWRGTLRGDDIGIAYQAVAAVEPVPFSGGRGFQFGEKYKLSGDHGWYRHWMPRSADATGSMAYESWEWDSRLTDDALGVVLGSFQQAKCTRIDLTVDFIFADAQRAFYVRPYAFRRYVRSVFNCSEQQTGTVDDAGRGGQTFYVGSRSSGRMLRIYEKHCQQGDFGGIPILRVEVELQDKHAQRAYAALLNGQQAGSIWRANVEGMLQGLPVWVMDGIETAELQSEPDDRSSVGESLLAMCNQWRAYLAPLIKLGALPVLEQVLALVPAGRASKRREREVVAFLHNEMAFGGNFNTRH